MSDEKKMGAPVRPPDGDNVVAKFRREWNLSQQQAAEELGITRTAVSMYERGERTPTKTITILIELLLKTGAK